MLATACEFNRNTSFFCKLLSQCWPPSLCKMRQKLHRILTNAVSEELQSVCAEQQKLGIHFVLGFRNPGSRVWGPKASKSLGWHKVFKPVSESYWKSAGCMSVQVCTLTIKKDITSAGLPSGDRCVLYPGDRCTTIRRVETTKLDKDKVSQEDWEIWGG